MAIEGELAGLSGAVCDCGEELPLIKILCAAGYYLGYFCPDCGPYSRETGYFPTREQAEKQLGIAQEGKKPEQLRDTEFVPGELEIQTLGFDKSG